MGRCEAPDALGTRRGRDLGPIPNDTCLARQLQQIASREIDEQQSRPGIDREIAQRVEKAIAAIIRHDDRAVGGEF